jgi:hypothetical protein
VLPETARIVFTIGPGDVGGGIRRLVTWAVPCGAAWVCRRRG